MHRLALMTVFILGACTATVRTAPAQPAPPPPQPVVVQSAPPPPPPQPMQAAPDQHPAYLHALTDLRTARAFLQRPAQVTVKWDEQRAIAEIDSAIREIKAAAIDDGKPLEDHPPIDRPTWGGRRQRSGELLGQARNDISQEEDSPSSRVHRLRGLAFQHIGNAERAVREGIEDARALQEVPAPAPPPPPPPPPPPSAHPAYLHALSDMRLARALLERPTRGAEVRWDEGRAIREIDAAIHEIKDASIDDGKPLNDHPPIDMGIHHRDRLRNALNLLEQSARDIEQREDNGYARGMRGRAIGHLRGAARAIREAIEDRQDMNR